MRLALTLLLVVSTYLIGFHLGSRAERIACDKETAELLSTGAELEEKAGEVFEVARSCEVASRVWLETATWYQRAYVKERWSK